MNSDSYDQFRDVRARYELLLEQESVKWKQRAKCFWLKYGDKNTKYFHMQATSRRKKNKVTELQNEEGEWFRDESGMQNHVLEYFSNVFQEGQSVCDPVMSQALYDLEEWEKANAGSSVVCMRTSQNVNMEEATLVGNGWKCMTDVAVFLENQSSSFGIVEVTFYYICEVRRSFYWTDYF
ncbi:hypothetical protein ACFE04_020190 [Oxalis oulophora]